MPIFRSFFRFSWVLAVVCGCGGGMGTYSSTSAVKAKAPLPINVNAPYFVNDMKQSLYERVRAGEAVPFGEVTQTLVKDHHINWVERHKTDKNPSISEFYSLIQSLAANLPSDDIAEIKNEIEKRLVKDLAGLQYNSNSISVLDATYAHKVQCFSGTLLLHMVLREAWGHTKFVAANTVAIYESGHVLPGYVEKKDGVWHLIGVETTVEGKGRVLYGPLTKAMEDRMLRVVDGELFTYVELFKFEADNLVELTNEAMRLTSEKYGFKDPAYLVPQRFRREADYGKLAWSPLGFGTADITQGDRKRATYEESPRADLPRANPNATIFHKPAPPPPAEPPKAAAVPSNQIFDPVYPYREVKAATSPDGKRFQCWDYKKGVWVDMPQHTKGDDGIHYISYNPCAMTRVGYEPLPGQIKIKAYVRPTRSYDEDGDYGE